MKYYKTEKFKKLQTSWYKKLERSGFEDAEKDGMLKTQNIANAKNVILNIAKLEYYAKAREFLRIHKFKTAQERKMFEKHTEGIGIREIAKRHRTYRFKVHKILQRLVKEMKGHGQT